MIKGIIDNERIGNNYFVSLIIDMKYYRYNMVTYRGYKQISNIKYL